MKRYCNNKRRWKTSEWGGKTCVKNIKGNFWNKGTWSHNVDRKRTKREVELVKSVTANVKTNSKSEDTKLLTGTASLVAEMLEIKKRQKSEKSKKEPGG